MTNIPATTRPLYYHSETKLEMLEVFRRRRNEYVRMLHVLQKQLLEISQQISECEHMIAVCDTAIDGLDGS